MASQRLETHRSTNKLVAQNLELFVESVFGVHAVAML